MRKWYTSKTVWAGIIAIVGALAGVATGEIAVVTGLQTLIGGLCVIFLRTGVAKSGENR